MKPFQYVMTRGVTELNLNELDVFSMCYFITNHSKDEYFFVFRSSSTLVEDGNGNVVGNLNINIHKTVWGIVGDYGGKYVVTLLLPEEY